MGISRDYLHRLGTRERKSKSFSLPIFYFPSRRSFKSFKIFKLNRKPGQLFEFIRIKSLWSQCLETWTMKQWRNLNVTGIGCQFNNTFVSPWMAMEVLGSEFLIFWSSPYVLSDSFSTIPLFPQSIFLCQKYLKFHMHSISSLITGQEGIYRDGKKEMFCFC